ncbi:MAG: S41 family peptidase [Planctomycetota bacterium]
MKNKSCWAALILVAGSLLATTPAPSQDEKTGPEKAGLSAPEEVFEELWGVFNERYAFFKLREVDWKAQYRKHRSRVTAKTTDDELFRILSELLAPLKDGHVTLAIKGKGKKKKEFCPEEQADFERKFPSRKLQKRFWNMIAGTLKAAGFSEPKDLAEVFSYCRSKDLGYLRIAEMEGPRKKALDRALDRILGELQDTRGIIIDIRDNPGGTDDFVYRVVTRFADKKRVGHYKKTKKGPGEDDFGELRTRYLEPGGTVRYKGYLMLLTNDASYSAADVFAMLMADLPQATLIGDHTNGIFSDMLEKKLPNGWKYSLSHQRYYSSARVCYEGRGIPVDVEVPNTRSDLEKGADPVVTRALELLSKRL